MANKVLFEIVATAKGVKVVQNQTDKLAKSSDKATKSTDKLGKSRDAYNRKEKGAAQISSNATKNFSKMQQGIDGGGGSGGLVRAYALLAANVFALTAAFGVLSRSAQIDTLTQSMEILSTTGGTYIKSLAKDMQQASGGAIDLAQSFRQVSLASSAGLNTSEIEGLTQVAKGAAISLGRDLPDAMDRIFRGAIKLEPEILDEIGLFVRVDEAAQKYADSVQKSASSLSQAEKRQGFLNEILEQGKNKFQEYADTVKPDPYVRLGAALGDIAQSGLSLLNGVLGPILSFLADSKAALTVVFGVLVFSLLKKAIPAMGQFNQGLAEQARKAADNAKKYSDGVTQTTKDQIKQDKKKLKSARDTAKKMTQTGPMLKLKVGGKDASGDLEKKLQDKTIKGKKRQELVEKRILDLTKKQGLAKREQMPGYKEELAALQKEKQINKEILDLKNQKEISPETGSLADRRQSSLSGKADRLSIVSGATDVGENKGMMAGFGKLNKDLKKNEKGLGFFARSATRAQGSISLLGGGISKLMMALGPFMMLFSMLAPMAMLLAKHLGIGSEEAKKFDGSLKNFGEMQEKISKRFDVQTTAMNNSTLSMLEQSKAILAYNNAQAGTMQTLTKLQKELKDFQFEMTNTASNWENFKAKFGLDRESKLIDAQADAIGKSIKAAIQAGDDTTLDAFKGMDNESVSSSIEAAENAVAADEKTAESRKTLGKITTEKDKDMRNSAKKLAEFRNNQALVEAGVLVSSRASRKAYERSIKNLSDKEIEHVGVVAQGIKANTDLTTTNDKLNISLDEGVAVTKEIGDEQQIAAKKQQAFADANKSATAEIGKFSSSFNIKTKVDGVIGSFDDLNSALKDLGEADTKEFFDTFSAADNAFKQMFTKDEIADIEKNGRATFDTLVEKLKKYQDNIITSKQELMVLGKVQKQFNKLSGVSFGAATEEMQAITDIATKKAAVASDEVEVLKITKGFTQEKIDKAKEILASGDDITKQEQDLALIGIKRADIQALIAAELTSQALNFEKLLAIATQDEKAGIKRVKAEQKLLETRQQLLEVSTKQIEATAQLNQLSRTGTTKLNAVDSAKATMDAAQAKYDLEVESMGLKKELLDYEMEILRLELDNLILQRGKDSGLAKENKRQVMNDDGTVKSDATGMFATIDNAAGKGKELIDNQMALAGDTLTLSFAKAIGDGFKGGVGEGLQIGAAAIAAYKEQIKLINEDGTERKPTDKEQTVINGMNLAVVRSTVSAMGEEFKKLGPEGELVATVVAGAMAIGDAFSTMTDTISQLAETDGLGKAVAMAEFASAAIAQVTQMMAANSKAQMAEMDGQIAAEKRRDGKSKESVAKIAQLEKKKEAMAKKAFEQNKKMQMAQVVVNTASGMMRAYKDYDGLTATALAVMIGALGAAQLSIISKTQYQGTGAGDIPKPKTSLSIGKRDNKVDVSRGASSGELSYMRGARGTGNANNFTPGGAMGRKGYAAGGEGILVGERGPEVITPSQKVDVIPNDRLGGSTNVNFSINAVDAAGVEDLLVNQRGNIIRMIREAANDTGERFLESVDVQTYGSNT